MVDPPFNFKGRLQIGPLSVDVDTGQQTLPPLASELEALLQERDTVLERLKALNDRIRKLKGRP